MALDFEKLNEELDADEGLRLKVYDDATGLPIGPGSVVKGHPTIGYGLALDVRGLTRDEAIYLRDSAVREKLSELSGLDWFAGLDDMRQQIIAEMAYQMGVDGVLGFTGMISAIRAKNYAKAAEEMLNSKWARQTPARAKRLAKRMQTGE